MKGIFVEISFTVQFVDNDTMYETVQRDRQGAYALLSRRAAKLVDAIQAAPWVREVTTDDKVTSTTRKFKVCVTRFAWDNTDVGEYLIAVLKRWGLRGTDWELIE